MHHVPRDRHPAPLPGPQVSALLAGCSEPSLVATSMQQLGVKVEHLQVCLPLEGGIHGAVWFHLVCKRGTVYAFFFACREFKDDD